MKHPQRFVALTLICAQLLASLSPINAPNVMPGQSENQTSGIDGITDPSGQSIEQTNSSPNHLKKMKAKPRKLAGVESKIKEFFELFPSLPKDGKTALECDKLVCPFDKSNDIGQATCYMHLVMCILVLEKFEIGIENVKSNGPTGSNGSDLPKDQLIIRFDPKHEAHGQKRVSVMFFKDTEFRTKQSKLCLDIESMLFHSTYNRLACHMLSDKKIQEKDDAGKQKKNLADMGEAFMSTVKAVLRMHFENSYELTVDHVYNFFRIFASQSEMAEHLKDQKKPESGVGAVKKNSQGDENILSPNPVTSGPTNQQADFIIFDPFTVPQDKIVQIPIIARSEKFIRFSLPLSKAGCLELTGRIELATESFIKLTMESGSQTMQLLIPRYINHELWLSSYDKVVDEIDALAGKIAPKAKDTNSPDSPKQPEKDISIIIKETLNELSADQIPRYNYIKSNIYTSLIAFIDIAKANQVKGTDFQCNEAPRKDQPENKDDLMMSIYKCIFSGFTAQECQGARKVIDPSDGQNSNSKPETKSDSDVDFIDFSFVVGLFEQTVLNEKSITYSDTDKSSKTISFTKIYHGEEDLMIDPYLIAIDKTSKKHSEESGEGNQTKPKIQEQEKFDPLTASSEAAIRIWQNRSETHKKTIENKFEEAIKNQDASLNLKLTLEEIGDESDFKIPTEGNPEWKDFKISIDKMVTDTILEVRKLIKGENFANDQPFSNFVKLEYGIPQWEKSFEVYIFEQNLEIYKLIHIAFITSLFSHEFVLPRLTISKMKQLFKLILKKMARHYDVVRKPRTESKSITYDNKNEIQLILAKLFENSEDLCVFSDSNASNSQQISYHLSIKSPRQLKLIDSHKSLLTGGSLPGMLFEGQRDIQCSFDHPLNSSHHVRKLVAYADGQQSSNKIFNRNLAISKCENVKANLFITETNDPKNPWALSFSDIIQIPETKDMVPIHASMYIAKTYNFEPEEVIEKFLNQIKEYLPPKPQNPPSQL